MDMGLENIWAGNGVAIAVTGMSIVFVALMLISVFITLLPKVLNAISFMLPAEHHPQPPQPPRLTQEDEVAAVVGFVLHQIESRKR